MKPRCITLLHVAKDEHIIVRVEPELRARLQRIAVLERRNLSDLARIVFEDYVNTQERALKLVLRDSTSTAATSAAGNQVLAAVATHYGPGRKPRKLRK